METESQTSATVGISIRALTPADVSALGKLFLRLASDNASSHFHPHPLTLEEAQRVGNGQPGRRDEYFGACTETRVIGYGMLRGWDEGYDIPAFGVAVDPDYRRRGVARKLLRHALALARERGSQTVMIKVHGQNPRARELYASEGFVFAETPDQHGQYWGLREL